MNPLARSATYNALADLPLAERVARLARPEVKAAVLAEFPEHPMRTLRLDQVYELGEQPGVRARPVDERAGTRRATKASTPDELLYDLLLGAGGTALLYVPILNYADGNLDAVGEMLAHPHTVPGLSDGGAHVGTICDGSFPTTLLMHWGRDRTRGERFEVPWLIKRQTADTAAALGLLDRGVLAPGYRADINVIDFERLGLGAPHLVFDLPAGGKRLLQRATGYRHTFVSGDETFVTARRRAPSPAGSSEVPNRAPDRTECAMKSLMISADSHVTEPPNTYIDNIDPAFRDRAPKMIDHEKLGDVFVIDGMSKPISLSTAAAAGKRPEEIRSYGSKFEELHPRWLGSRRPDGRSGA